mgnify:CR=1 FL=1
MTYEQIIRDFFQVCEAHKMIQTWGYGQLTDLVDPYNQEAQDYPYAFLIPQSHLIAEHSMQYNFQLIMQELVMGGQSEVIRAQSDALLYIKDILAHFYYHLEGYDFDLNVQVTPFREKYDDSVAGMTANIQFIVRDALDDCIAPYE